MPCKIKRILIRSTHAIGTNPAKLVTQLFLFIAIYMIEQLFDITLHSICKHNDVSDIMNVAAAVRNR